MKHGCFLHQTKITLEHFMKEKVIASFITENRNKWTFKSVPVHKETTQKPSFWDNRHKNILVK